MPACPFWPERNLKADPQQLFSDYRENNSDKLMSMLKRGGLPVAVGVTEMTGPPPNPHMFTPPSPTDQKPRLVAVGNSVMASNMYTNSRAGQQPIFEFVTSSVEWLREKPGNIGIPPKKHQVYTLPATTSFWPFFLMPTALILLGVVGMGTGVWLVRRR